MLIGSFSVKLSGFLVARKSRRRRNCRIAYYEARNASRLVPFGIAREKAASTGYSLTLKGKEWMIGEGSPQAGYNLGRLVTKPVISRF